jgi:hypothetical protein
MGKAAQKAAVQQSHILGHGEGGRGGGAARLQILGGKPMWMGPFGSTLRQYGSYYIIIIIIIIIMNFGMGPTWVYICFRLFTLFAQRESYDA